MPALYSWKAGKKLKKEFKIKCKNDILKMIYWKKIQDMYTANKRTLVREIKTQTHADTHRDHVLKDSTVSRWHFFPNWSIHST